ncbi:MAG: hypothetical protein ACN4GG_07495 [Akkermansiaceae bacterium]
MLIDAQEGEASSGREVHRDSAEALDAFENLGAQFMHTDALWNLSP